MIRQLLLLLLVCCFSKNILANFIDKPNTNTSRTTLKLIKETRLLSKRLSRADSRFLQRINKAEKQIQIKLCHTQPIVADDIFRYDVIGNTQLRNSIYKQQETFPVFEEVANWSLLKDSTNLLYKGLSNTSYGENDLLNNFNLKASNEFKQGRKAFWADSVLKKNLNITVLKVSDQLERLDYLQQFLRTRKEQLRTVTENNRPLKRSFKKLSRNVYYLKASSEEWKDVYKEKVLAILSKPENKEETLARIKGFPMHPLDSISLAKGIDDAALSLNKQNLNGSVESNKASSPIPNMQSNIKSELKDEKLDNPTGKLSQINDDIKDKGKELDTEIKHIDSKIPNKETIVASANSLIGQDKNIVKHFIQKDIEGNNASELIEKNMQDMHGQLRKLKSRYNNISNAGDIPDSKVNPYKVKPLKKRIEWGWNAHLNHNQFWKATGMSAGVEAGFLYSPRLTLGTGIDYSLGWTSKMKHLFDEGVNGRMYFDWKLLKGIYLTGYAIPPIPAIKIKSEERVTSKDLNRTNMWLFEAGVKWRLIKKGRKGPEMQLLYSINHTKMGVSALTYRVGWK